MVMVYSYIFVTQITKQHEGNQQNQRAKINSMIMKT